MLQKKYLIIGLFVLGVVGIPAAVLLNQTSQDTRSRASGSTTLTLTPDSTNDAPITKSLGEPVSFDIMVNPGTNLPSSVKLEILYDATIFDSDTDSFAANTAAFPTTVEGPVITDGKILVSVSIGSDSTKAIQKVTKVGTVKLIPKKETSAPTKISFGTVSEVLSVASSDEASENVLSTTAPAYVAIVPPQPTSITLTAFLHGIGNSGDNANPDSHSMSNKTPLHETRQVFIEVFNDKNELAATKSGTVSYNKEQGNFKGTFDFDQNLAEGDYIIKVKEPTHLRKQVGGIIHLLSRKENILPQFAFVAGDINNDNTLNILDYNILTGCYSDLLPAVACDDVKKEVSDLNDNGSVNQYDYNLFLREIIVQNGG